MRLIDGDALYDSIYNLACSTVLVLPDSAYAEGLHTASHYVEEAPTVEPVKGKWVERWVKNSHTVGDMECSNCKNKMLLPYTRFCPMCGANMYSEYNGKNNGNIS